LNTVTASLLKLFGGRRMNLNVENGFVLSKFKLKIVKNVIDSMKIA
jgi:hypothetical protein